MSADSAATPRAQGDAPPEHPTVPYAAQYDEPGISKVGPGAWVVNDGEARRLGLLVHEDRYWHAECDIGCVFPPTRFRQVAENDLRRHWWACQNGAKEQNGRR